MRFDYERARQVGWSRTKVEHLLNLLDCLERDMGHTPGTSAYLHRKWRESLASFDPETFEFDEEDVREAAEVVNREVEAEELRHRMRNVLRFPQRQE